MSFDALLFDFDGVLIESESVGNQHLADTLTMLGHPTTREEAMREFMGLSGAAFREAVERWIGRPIPEAFDIARKAEDARCMSEGVAEVAGAGLFVRGLPGDLPVAVVSSSSTRWLRAHLAHLDLGWRFEPHVYSGREHVARGKPAPDIYLFGADQLGVDIRRCVILEDSPVGAQGAVASGAFVIGLAAGTHCLPGHEERLRALGVSEVAHSFEEVAEIIADNGGW